MLDVADPGPPTDGRVLLEVRAAGVGNWDEVVRTGGWDVGRSAPMALGVEAAGVVIATGPDVRNWSVGDEVLTHPLPLVGQGAWAPSLSVPAALLARKPPAIGWSMAGALPVPALTAMQVLDEALRLRAGERLLVSGAGSVTGSLLVALAASRDVEVFATAGASSRERVVAAGARFVFDYSEPDWVEQLLEATGGRGVEAAGSTAPGAAAAALGAVRDGGRLATITSDAPASQRGIAVSSVVVRPDAGQLEQACAALADRPLPFVLGAEFALEQAGAALARAVSGPGGATVLLPRGAPKTE
jgi:NADPH:quinone reductase-like Zn-dependent oxidoreductase